MTPLLLNLQLLDVNREFCSCLRLLSAGAIGTSNPVATENVTKYPRERLADMFIPDGNDARMKGPQQNM